MVIHLRLNNTLSPYYVLAQAIQSMNHRQRRANARNVRLYTIRIMAVHNLFIFRFISLLCLRSTLRLLYKAWFSNINSSTVLRTFPKSVCVCRFRINTGNLEHPGDIFSDASVELLTSNNKATRQKGNFLEFNINKTLAQAFTWATCTAEGLRGSDARSSTLFL